jgi:chromatin structure-remodeling complex subunit RSC1/2
MFNNAKVFNVDSSQIFKDAVMLQEELHRAAEHERSRKDEDLVGGEDGASYAKNTRIPVEKIEHKGETYRVGKFYAPVNRPMMANNTCRRLDSHC